MIDHIVNKSTASRKNYEAVTNDKFRVTFILPNSLGQEPLLTEHVISCTGLKEPGGETIQQQVNQVRRNFASNDVDNTQNFELTFSLNLNEANQNYIWKKMKAWKNLVYNPTIGAGTLKASYVGTIIIESFNRQGDVYEVITTYNTFPTGETTGLWDKEITSPDPVTLAIPFIADYANFVDV